MNKELIFWYRNYRGQEGYRRVRPLGIRFGTNEWHTDPQWLLLAIDLEKDAEREFAMCGITSFVGPSEMKVAS